MQSYVIEGFRLSPQQRRLWTLQDGGEPLVSTFGLGLRGDLDARALEQAIRRVVERHEILRTTFHGSGKMKFPLQVVQEGESLKLPELRTEVAPGSDLAEAFERLAAPDGAIDLQNGPLLRCCLTSASAGEHLLVVQLPSLCADLESLKKLAQELGAAYASLLDGDPLPESPIQYVQYSEWRNQMEEQEPRSGGDAASGEAEPPLHLPFATAAGAGSTPFAVRSLSFEVPAGMEAAAAGLAARHQAEPAAFWLACWHALLWKLTSRQEVTTGYVFSGRTFEELADSIGPFAQMVPLRIRLAADYRFEELLEAAASALREAAAGEGVQDASPEDSRGPLAIQFESVRSAPVPAAGLEIRLLRPEATVDRFELKLSHVGQGHCAEVRLSFDPAAYPREAVERLGRSLQTLARDALDDPTRRIDRLALLGDSDRRELLVDFNATEAPLDSRPVHEWLDERCRERPAAVALVGEDGETSFAELARDSDRLAVHLQSLGIGPEDRVGICLRRSSRLVVAILGVLKAGAAYVPLDPDDPPQRLRHVLSDSAPRVLLGEADTLARLETGGVATLALDAGWEEIASGAADRRPAGRVHGESLAYVIYTSGSTGAPKGVQVEHRQLSSYLQAVLGRIDLPEGAVYAMVSTPAADLGYTMLYPALCTGGCLHMVAEETARDPDRLAAYFARHRVDALKIVPSHLSALLTAAEPEKVLPRARLVLGGEALPHALFRRVAELAPECRVINHYGPTETTVGVLTHPLESTQPDGPSARVPLGRPLGNVRVYVLDRYLEPVPAGVPGELYVGGAQVARGYLGRAELTAERFVPDPFSGKTGARLYRTGDRARWLADGTVEFLGRVDHQVKVRGYRVELGEIEAVLRGCEAVREAVVVLREDTPGDPRLTAYLVLREKQEGVGALRGHLAERLPEHMVPSHFVTLEALPLARSGKVDRDALPRPEDSREHLGPAYAAPRTLVEEVLSTVWSEVLGLDRVGIDDNLFALGGDSIRSIRIGALARQRGLSIANQDLFQYQTIRELAQRAHFGEEGAEPPFSPTAPFELLSDEDRGRLPDSVEDAFPLAALQTGMVFHSEYAPESVIFHHLHTIDLKIRFDREALHRTLVHLFERHPVLRGSFDLASYSRPVMLVHRSVPIPLDVEDLRGLSEEEQREVLDRWTEEEKHRAVDWTQPPLLRFTVHRRSDETCRFALGFHHAVLDGWSVAILLTELFRTYLELLEGAQPTALPETSVSFRDFVALEQAAVRSPEAQSFWRSHLHGSSVRPLPRIGPEGERSASGVHLEAIEVPEAVSDGLKQLSRSLSVPIKSILLAAHLRVLGHWTGQYDVITGLVANGRPEVMGGDRVVGLFLNSIPFRARLRGESWADLARQVFETERDTLPHRRYPLALLQQENGGGRLFDTAFNFVHYHVYQSVQDLDGDVEVMEWGGYGETDIPLTANFAIDPVTSRIRLQLNCSPAELEGEQVRQIADSYARVLEAMALDPSGDFRALDLMAPEELERQRRFNDTTEEEPDGFRPVHEWLDERCRETPQEAAVLVGDAGVSFQQLAEDSDRLAVHLQSLGIGPEDRVGICLRRSSRLVVAILGVLKAGAAYVPLDPDDPPQRLRHVLSDSAPRLLLGEREELGRLEADGISTLALDERWEEIATLAGERRPEGSVDGDHLAYVIYTSGSTGAPKGTCVTHRGLLNYLRWACRYYRVEQGRGTVLHSPVTFDLSVTSLFAPLLAGRPVRVLPPGAGLQELVEVLEGEEEWSFLKLTPAHLEALSGQVGPGAARSARVLVVGGEALHAEQIAFWRREAPEVRIVNEYGPTETVVGCCIHEVQVEDPQSGPVPIGRPVANTRLYVLDAEMQPVPMGVQGELYIGGAGVARGYHRRPALTAERFVPDPHAGRAGERLYRTGDAVRFRATGELEFLGRLDEQVKIRGYRVELGEIESVLRGHPAVREAVVVLRGNTPGGPRLAAYLVYAEEQGEVGVGRLRAYLRERLPEYMVPSRFVILEALPLTRAGKVDRKALPAPDRSRPDTEREFVAPRNDVERTLAGIWAEVLGVERVGVHDHFFELGGHSLLALTLIERMRRQGLHAELRALFTTPTLAEMAAAMGGESRELEVPANLIPQPEPDTPDADSDADSEEVEIYL